jgi:AcrR family transcriptional regulator
MNPHSSSEKRVQNLRSRLREESAQAMIAAAEEVFAARGISRASMGEIAAKAGVAVGTLYNHFADREALLEALLAARRARLKEKLDETLHAAAREPFQRQLTALVHALFEHFEAHRPFITMCVSEYATPAGKKLKTMRDMLNMFDKVIKRGVQEGALRPSRGGLHTTLLMGAVQSLMLNEADAPGRGPFTRHVDELVEFFLRGAGR